jgi:predicted DNA-binding transcriptional regulator AlpA
MNKLLSPRELSQILSLAEQTIYNRHSKGGSLPPCIKIGNRLRFRSSDVDTWITAQVEGPRVPQAARAATPTTETRRRGRPTKAVQVARRNSAAAFQPSSAKE